MQLFLSLLALLLAVAMATGEKVKNEPQFVIIELGKQPLAKQDEQKHEQSESKKQSGQQSEEKWAKESQVLLADKSETLLAKKLIEHFEQNPEKKFQQECFRSKIQSEHDSIDFVIDLAPSPSQDKLDATLADSPFSVYFQEFHRKPSRAYFGTVEVFIELVTMGMDPKATHTVIYDNGRKFFIRGRSGDEAVKRSEQLVEDKRRNLKTLWPRNTKTLTDSCFRSVVKNSLGHVTKMALHNRDNALPTVLSSQRHSKPFYTIVITDGASGAKISELSDDLSRTTVIDVGNRRFVKKMDWSDMRRLGGHVFTFTSPMEMLSMIDTCRVMACRFASHR